MTTTRRYPKKAIKIAAKLAGIFIAIIALLSISSVQTQLGKLLTKRLNTTYNTSININKAGLEFNGSVELKDIMIKDHHNDTLIYVDELNTSLISFTKILDQKLNLGKIKIKGLRFNLKTYGDESDSNLDVFVAKFDKNNPKPKDKKFELSSNRVEIINSYFSLINQNLDQPNVLDFKDLNILGVNFYINGPNVGTEIQRLNFDDYQGIEIDNLQTNFSYSLSQMRLDEFQLLTPSSTLNGQIIFDYERQQLKDFVNSVKVSGYFENTSVNLEELKVFFDEFGSSQRAKLNTSFQGTLNDLSFKDLNITATNTTRIIGDFNFENMFSKGQKPFQMKAMIKSLNSDYTSLQLLLPKLLGNRVPSNFEALGRFNINGSTSITSNTIEADLNLDTKLGLLSAKLNLSEAQSIDTSVYAGQIIMNNFDLGRLVGDSKMGEVSADLVLSGTGFTIENMKSDISGTFDYLNYNGYPFAQVEVLGEVQDKVFNGQLNTVDPNLKLVFEGLIDFSSNENIYDFTAQVDYANLNALKLVSRDSISTFKGNVYMDMNGTSINDAYGSIRFIDTFYENQNENYFFEDFEISSEFNVAGERKLSINSPEIIEGEFKGKFDLSQLSKLVKNSLGDIYTNLSLNRVSDGQYLDFKFNIYNKIIEVFYPDIKLGSNTFLKGRLESDPKNFEMTFKSPQIDAEDFFANQLEVRLVNDNPLFNSYIEIDSIATPQYKASNFSLINITLNDTLYVKSEFKGGRTNSDHFDLNLYYTIDDNNKSVVGFKSSKVNFKNTPWKIGASKTHHNQIIFDREFSSIQVDDIALKYLEQEMNLNALIEKSNSKLDLIFKNVDLSKVTPEIDSLKLNGVVNGQLNIDQQGEVYLPKSNITIDDFEVNAFNFGNFNASIVGNESLTNYNVDISIKDQSKESLSVTGFLDVSGADSDLNLDVSFKDFMLNPLTPFGSGVITNIRGLVSGNANVSGRLERPQINGGLILQNGGLSVPYLNIDYEFGSNSAILLEQQSFIFDDVQITDTEYSSQALLRGYISHMNFSNWSLDLNIDSDRLLVLNTSETEESLYYGTALVDGNVTISGPMEQLYIEANVSTSEGTALKIPLNDNEILSENSYITFISPEQKEAQSRGRSIDLEDIKGVEMEFNLDVNDNAEIEIILDKQTGSAIRGRGNGSMLAQINTNGKFQMFGDFIVLSGVYNYTFGRIIQKKFSLIKDGTLAWEGDPLKAAINIKALYDGINVNPSTLLDNPINQSIPVEVETHLTGQLEQPDLDFNIRFPNVNSTLNSELNDRLRDNDKRQLQAISLLATGSFRNELTLDSQDAIGLFSDGVTAMLNELFSDEENKVQLGLNVDIGENTPEYETDSRVGVTLSTKISDNVLINGKVGVPVGGVSETTVAGDFEVEILLNEDRTLSLKFFNKENSIQNFGEQIGYTQGVGVSYNIEFNNLKELLNKLFKTSPKTLQNE